MLVALLNLKEVPKMDNHSLSHTTWNCKYHIVFAPKYRRKIIYNQLKVDIGKFYGNSAIEREFTLSKQSAAPIIFICSWKFRRNTAYRKS